jgi:hypothetical protein
LFFITGFLEQGTNNQEEPTMEFTLFDPTIPVQPESINYASRPKRLNNLKILLIENTKYNSKTILLKLFDSLKNRYQMQLVGVIRKQSAGHPIAAADIEECVKTADIAIAGIGD